MSEYNIRDLTRTVRTKLEECMGEDCGNEDCDCWIWTGALDAYGYSSFKLKGKVLKTHRYVYEKLVAPIPDDLDIDHLCTGHRNCCNPAHMEPVTRSENSIRANHRRHVEGYRRTNP